MKSRWQNLYITLEMASQMMRIIAIDLDVDMAMNTTTFYNQWQLQALDLAPTDEVNNQFMEDSEVNLFGFPPMLNISDPDMKTSTDRPFYAAVNMYRGSGGNPQCGGVSLVLSREYVKNKDVLASPLDTGFYNIACGNGQETGVLGDTVVAICNAWPEDQHILGVPPYIHHILQPYITFYNESQSQAGVGEDYPYLNLARLVTRILSRKTYESRPFNSQAMPLNFVENTLGYFEFNPAKTIPLPRGIKMIVAMYELYWGTETGDKIRKWCRDLQIPLVWAYNPIMSFFRCGPDPTSNPACVFPDDLSVGIDTTSVRILDINILSELPAYSNITISPTQMTAFEEAWQTVNVTDLSHDAIDSAWYSFIQSFWDDLGVEPVYYNACASKACVGVTVGRRNGDCVCPSDSS
jgi:hypothetical protein